MLMNIGTMPMTRTRVDDDGNMTTENIRADDHGDGNLYLAVDADIDVGDIVEYKLPNGKPRTMKIIKHDVFQAPGGLGMGAGLNHTKCQYEVVGTKPSLKPKRVNIPGLHDSISDASGAQFRDGHYDDAVFNAFKAVEDRVKSLAGSEVSGKQLMANVAQLPGLPRLGRGPDPPARPGSAGYPQQGCGRYGRGITAINGAGTAQPLR
jgi:hypothetical protein